jgi:hypothetical protein
MFLTTPNIATPSIVNNVHSSADGPEKSLIRNNDNINEWKVQPLQKQRKTTNIKCFKKLKTQ